MTLKYKSFGFTKAAQENVDDLIIEGYANKKIVDSWGEIMEPTGCDFTRFDLNPISFFNHDRDYPIGQVVEREIKDDGLFVKIKISNSTDDKITYVRDLIKEGILKTFSIGFMPIDSKENEDKSTTITKWELHEVSVVSLPMNQESTFSVAQGKSFNKTFASKSYSEAKSMVENINGKEDTPPPPPPANENDDENKNAFQDCVSAKIPKLIDEGKPQDQAIAIAISMCSKETEGKCEITPELLAAWNTQASACKPKKDNEKQTSTDPTVNADPAQTTPSSDNVVLDLMKAQLSMLGAINSNLMMIKTILEKEEINEPEEPQETTPNNPPPENQQSEAIDAVKKYMQTIDSKLKELGI